MGLDRGTHRYLPALLPEAVTGGSTIPTSDVISVEVADHIASVWLDRPEARNAMAPAFWDEFPVIIEALDREADVRVIVVAARGPAFSVGIDLKAFGPMLMGGSGEGSPVTQRRSTYEDARRLQHTFNALGDARKPTIAAVHGYCLGAGVDLITAVDIRLASEDAVFSVRETKIGMVADLGTLQRLPLIVGHAQVAEMAFTGRDFSADEAHELGLVSRVYPNPEELHEAANELAAEIASNSPLAVQGTKAVLNRGRARDVEANLDYVALWNAAFLHSNDFIEGVSSFIQKRPPEFTGE